MLGAGTGASLLVGVSGCHALQKQRLLTCLLEHIDWKRRPAGRSSNQALCEQQLQ